MGTTLTIDDLKLDVVYKDIKNVHLSVHPPTGRVRIAAPHKANPDVVRAFAISKLAWIRRQQRSLLEQEREPPREYEDRESHYVWGRRYLLRIEKKPLPPAVTLDHRHLVISVRPEAGADDCEEVLSRWYRTQVRELADELISKWEPMLGVRPNRFYVQRMKTMWGSCTPATSTIRLNTELAKKPPECLEYIVVHELAHLIEPTHSERFVKVMDRAMPNWRNRRRQLSDLPIRHEKWLP